MGFTILENVEGVGRGVEATVSVIEVVSNILPPLNTSAFAVATAARVEKDLVLSADMTEE